VNIGFETDTFLCASSGSTITINKGTDSGRTQDWIIKYTLSGGSLTCINRIILGKVNDKVFELVLEEAIKDRIEKNWAWASDAMIPWKRVNAPLVFVGVWMLII
jgi:hypothetical protein